MAGPVRRQGVQSLVPPFRQRASADGMLVPADLGPAPFAPSQPRGGQASRRIILPGADYPPADAIPVDEIGDASIAAGASATLVTVLVPGTLTFRMAGIGFGADDETSLRFLQWTINASPPNAPIPGYSLKPATVGSVPQLSYIFAVIGSSVTITVVATNNNALTLYFVCRLQGWFYSELEAA